MKLFKLLMVAGVVVWSQSISGLALAQAQEPTARYTAPAVEDLMRFPKLAGLKMSRNGRYLAGTSLLNGRMNLVVIDLETRQGTSLTNFADVDAVNVRWVGDEKLLFSIGRY
ncbi:MAG: hypothetical protein ACR2I0_10675, partial [Rhodoferax sp.]